MKPVAVAFTAAVFLVSPGALAAQDGELWEITNQMNVPGMPAGMGPMTSRVCQEKGRNEVMPEKENCKITDMKRSGSKTTMTVVCGDSRAVIEQTYNAAGTEFKGTMRMTGGQGDMTMAMSGRKVGSCDATAERKKQEAQMAGIERQHAQAQAMMRKERETQVAQCNEAVQTMNYEKLGSYGMCKQSGHAEYCKAMSDNPDTQPVATACMARQAEFCKRYSTEEGFIKAKADPKAGDACGTSAEQVKAALCPGAAQRESLDFLGRYCPVEAKPLAQKYCAGRDFTALRASGGKADKYDQFCYAYLSNSSLAATPAQEPAAPSAATLPDPAKAVTEGVTQGINKLRGLFGR